MGMLVLVVAALVVPAAQAAKPTMKVVPNNTTVFDAGHACAFRVIDTTLPDSKRVERVFSNGRHLITGPARQRLTNPKSGASIVRNSSGTVSYKRSDDGTTRFTFTGPNVLYFYPGDDGPGGKVGGNGGLYHVVGKVSETLAKDGVVTSFTLHGRATALCVLLR